MGKPVAYVSVTVLTQHEHPQHGINDPFINEFSWIEIEERKFSFESKIYDIIF
jgi:hypothetical protein